MHDRLARFRGCLLGGAVGDALGAPVEFHSWDRIEAEHGPGGLGDFAEAYGRIGAITDDTQMTLFTAEALIRAGNGRTGGGGGGGGGAALTAAIHRGYLRWLATQGPGGRHDDDGWLLARGFLHDRRAPGLTSLGALQTGHIGTRAAPLNDSMGCGGVMRVAPIGLFLDDLDDVYECAADAAAVTHGHAEGWIPAGAFAVMVAAAAQGCGVRDAVEAGRAALRRRAPESRSAELLDRAIGIAGRGAPTVDDIEALGGAWVGPEALAISVCCALACGDDFGRGVLSAVNHSGDSDSTAAVCGNLLGAALGEDAIPGHWLDRLEGRDVVTRLADDLLAAREGGVDTSDQGWRDRYPPP